MCLKYTSHKKYPHLTNWCGTPTLEVTQDTNRTEKIKMVFLNWMNITMQHSKGRGVRVSSHLALDALLWQHLWLDLKQLHCYGLASAPV